MDQFNLVENVDNLFHSLENFTQKEGVIGKPVTQSQKTFLPVVSVTIGYGGGNASMKKDLSGSASANAGNSVTNNSGSGALGLGAKLNTEAIIMIDDQNQNVSILPMNTTGAGQIMDKIPQILSGINLNKQSQQPSSQSQQPQAGQY